MLNTIKQCLCLLPILFALFIFITTIILLAKDKKTADQMEAAKQVLIFTDRNLNKKPIYQITGVDELTNCLSGFTEMYVGEFDEISGGCICQDGSVHSKAYCYLKMKFTTSCKILSGQSEISLKLWTKEEITPTNKASPKLMKICAKLNQDSRYVSDNTCPSQYKMCYDNLCIQSHEECPLNQMKYEKYTTQAVTDNTLVIQG